MVNSTFFTSMWAYSSKYLLPKQQLWLQLLMLPLICGLNVWVGRSSAAAYSHGVPYLLVKVVSVGTGAVLSVVLGILVLKQGYSWFQISGFVLVVAGVLLLNKH